jgi:hypothetical protein
MAAGLTGMVGLLAGRVSCGVLVSVFGGHGDHNHLSGSGDLFGYCSF